MLDREYKQMYADIKPDGLLIAEVKEKMKKEPDLKKAFLRKILLWCGSAAAVIAVVTMTITTLWNGGSPIDTGKNASAFSSIAGSESGADFDLVAEPVIPEWYKPGRLNVLALLQKTKLTGVSAGIKTDMIQPLGVTLTADSSVPLTKAKDTELTLPEGYKQEVNAFVGDSFIWMYTENQQDTHYGCYGTYYDIRQKKTLCFSHQAKQILSNAGMLTKDSVVNSLMENPYNGNCLASVKDNVKNTVVFYACNADGSVEKLNLPVKISSALSTAVNSDHGHGALAISRESDDAYFRVWAIDLNGQKITVKEISKINGTDYRAGEDLRFTPNGRYLIYNIAAENGNLYHFNAREQWVAYDTRTGTSVRGSGKFLRYIQDGNVAIMETTSGGKVIDLSSGKDLSKSASLEDWEKVQVIGMGYSSGKYGHVNEISLENVFNSKQKNIIIRTAVNVYLEKDGYVYSYLHGDKHVECYSIQTGEKFTVPVSQKMLDEIASYGKNVYFNYEMQLNKDGTEILLSYSAYSSAIPIDSVVDGQVIAFRNANCLVDMASFVRNNFDMSQAGPDGFISMPDGSYISGEYSSDLYSDSYSSNYNSKEYSSRYDTSHDIPAPASSQNEASSDLYSRLPQPGEDVSTLLPERSAQKTAKLMLGNGYSGLILYSGSNTIEVFVEDYRDQTFTYYRYWESLDGIFAVYDDPSLPASIQFRKSLSSQANQQATKKQYNDLPLVEPMYDYATLYTNGSLDSNKVFRAIFNRMVDKKLVTQVSIGAHTVSQGRGTAYEYEDKTCIYSILKVLAKHDQFHPKSDMEGSNLFWEPKKLKESDTRYWIVCHVGNYSRDVILGRDANKKPFVCYGNAYYYYISEQEYAELAKECKEAAEKAKQAHQSAQTVW